MWRTPSRRRSGGHLAAEALAGEGRRAGAARGLLGDPSNELCREVRCGESSSTTPCAFPRLPHWRCSLCHSVSWTTAAARGAGCSITRLQGRVEWCIAIGLLRDLREERSGDVPTGVVV